MSSSISRLNKCVYFVGPGSTGKTTLSEALREKCTPETPFLTEVARSVLHELGYNADDISDDATKCYELQKGILINQCLKEKEFLDMNRRFISDRSAIDPIVYAKFFIQNDAFESLCNLEEWCMTKSKYQDRSKTLIVLIEPNEIFLKADGTRKMPKDLAEWVSFYRLFVTFMTENDIPFRTIPSSLTNIHDRTTQVIEWLQD